MAGIVSGQYLQTLCRSNWHIPVRQPKHAPLGRDYAGNSDLGLSAGTPESSDLGRGFSRGFGSSGFTRAKSSGLSNLDFCGEKGFCLQIVICGLERRFLNTQATHTPNAAIKAAPKIVPSETPTFVPVLIVWLAVEVAKEPDGDVFEASVPAVCRGIAAVEARSTDVDGLSRSPSATVVVISGSKPDAVRVWGWLEGWYVQQSHIVVSLSDPISCSGYAASLGLGINHVSQ